jgi:hypothetical protein
MKVGNLVRGHVPIKWGEKLSEKEVVYPGLKAAVGIIIDKKDRSKQVLVLVDGNIAWWHTKDVKVINENR